MNNDLELLYTERYPKLKEIAEKLDSKLKEILQNQPRIDMITVRAKSIDRFIKKASRLKDGEKQYPYPLQEIQDQIGARVVVYYLSDVADVSRRILEYYRTIEDRFVEDADPWRFSYRAQHHICRIPPDIETDLEPQIQFFELQISTLFQHAWAEANHDLIYKSDSILDHDTERKIAWAAAQAWGADKIFDEVFKNSQVIQTDKPEVE